VELAHAGDGRGRLFIVEQAGLIKVLSMAQFSRPLSSMSLD
jgi:hypothetical protein